MKLQRLIIILTLFVFTSCVKDEDRVFEGLTFVITNETDIEYDAEIFIGGMENGVFVWTESKLIAKIKLGGNNPHYFIDENRWKPNLELIRALSSENCYFKLKLTNNREEILKIYNTTNPFNIDISNGKKIEGDEGRMYLYLYDDKVFGENN